jgi:hypothetical protein
LNAIDCRVPRQSGDDSTKRKVLKYKAFLLYPRVAYYNCIACCTLNLTIHILIQEQGKVNALPARVYLCHYHVHDVLIMALCIRE